MLKILLFLTTLSFANVYQTQVKDLSGNWVSMSEYKGKVILAVNTASKCGYTPQLKDLESLYQKYKSKNFVVLGFPSDDFNQEDLDGEKIKSFCKLNYGVTFPLFEKTHVTGDKMNPFYKKLFDSLEGQKIGWNFEKILVDSEGKVVKKYKSSESPLGGELEKTIKNLLVAKSDKLEKSKKESKKNKSSKKG
jgi:glutathione peroxidase